MTVQTAGRLHQRLATFNNGRIGRRGSVSRSVGGRLQKKNHLRSFIRREPEIRHPGPGVMLARFAQKGGESAWGEFLAHLVERNLPRIVLRGAGCVVAGDAVE